MVAENREAESVIRRGYSVTIYASVTHGVQQHDVVPHAEWQEGSVLMRNGWADWPTPNTPSAGTGKVF